MQYRGFEVYATPLPEGFVPEERAAGGTGKVFACEIYRAEDIRIANVLAVFDLVEGKDISEATDEALIAALKGYVDVHYTELMAATREPSAGVKEILVRISVDEKAILGEAGQECLEDAITQELGWLHDSGMVVDGWEFVDEKELVQAVPEPVSNEKAQVFCTYEELTKLQERPEYRVAAVMAYLEEHCEPDVPLNDEELFVLADKFVEATGSWFGTTASQQEYLIAFADLLECGITTHNNPDFSELGALETRKLLLEADEQVFGTLVESAAVENCYRYLPNDYQVNKQSLNAVEKAIEAVLNGQVASVDEKLADAQEKAGNDINGRNMASEKVLD